ncbi:MAG TPA: SDR family NAD(P)-dependent oxidoreductase, partial [Polyangium sp.]|nr:SDR family NAD(P)-dependent oxidoreductase [Polyangium sp.]
MSKRDMNDQDPSPELNGFAEVQSWLIARVAELGELDPQAIDPRERLSHYGLGSLASVRLLADLSAALGRPLPATLIWEQPTIEALSRYVAREGGELSPPRGKGASAAATLEPIAIVGLSCRFPKAPNAAAFWKLLREGVDATTEVPSDRWDVDALYDADRSAPGKMITRRAGFLEQVDGFDPLFFGISPREAREMDPQQRLMLELVWEALEDAGLPAAKLAGSRTGIFVGAIWHDYADLVSGQFESMTGIRATGQALNMIANRVSYALDLQGPSVVMDTACSSSLVAIHLACQSLWYGDTTLALAGGVNLILAPDTMVALSKFGGLSPSGRSKAFDASADGFGRGEGAGVVVLKPLSKAIADGDPIRCVIRATAVNNDGLSNGLTAPNPAAQEDVLREAYRRARLEPSQVHYVEAHGTGTALGDPIEAKALGRVLGEGRPADRPLYIGSVKTNIGHLEGAAGIAGLIKTILAIEHQEIPPSLHFEQPNPHIPFDELRLKVPQALEPWPASAEPALAAVSSFGWGGTNAHIVIEGQPRGELDWLALSAESAEALEARVGEALASAELGAQSRSTLGIPSSIGASPHRLAVGFRSRAELEEHLRAFLRGQPQAGLAFGRAPDGGRKLVFVCSPQGPQWVGMGRTLMRREPVFRGVLEQCDRELSRHTGWSLLDELFADEPNARFDDVDVIQPILVCLQIALAAQWRAWGVEPAAVVGHSLGEVSAACIAGILDLKDAIRIIHHYSRCQKLTANQGGMALVELPADELQRLIDDSQGRISLAGYNSPRSTVLSGEPAALGAALEELKQRGVRCALIKVNVAAHSPQMDAIQEELTAALSGIQPRRATIPMFSTLTGEVLSGHEIDPSYFPRNLRQPVRLAQVMDRLLADGFDVFVELSPQPALTYALQQSVKGSGREAMVFASLERANEEDAPLFDTRAKLYALGIPGEPTQGGAAPASSREELLVLSARSSAALRDMARATSSWIAERSDLRLHDLCYTASVRRSHHDHRLSVVGSSGEEIAAALSAFCREEPQASVATGQVQPWARPKVVFVYPGQGSQWAGMGRALLATEPVFRAALEACDTLVRRYAGFSLMDELLAPEETSRLEETEVAQPALFAIEVALSALFASWGVRPDAVIGHSVGEVAAAHVAGALSLPEAVRLVCLRGRVMQRATGLGKMAAVALPEAEARRALEGHEDLLSIAAVNDPGSVVLSGEAVALEQVLTQLRQQNVRCRMLPVHYAFHSQQMDVFAGELGQTLGALETRPAELVMYSSVSGAGVPGEALDAAYWARNVREPVHFARAIETAFGEGHRIFVEVGPHPVLAGHLEQCLHGHAERGQVLATLRRQREERRSVLSALGALYAAGSHVDWAPLFPWGGLCVPLPTYPWQREHYWIEAGRAVRGLTSTGHPLLGARVPVAGTSTVFEAALGLAAAPYLVDHRVYDQLVVPGAGVLELALAAAVAQDGAQPSRLQGLVIQSPLVVPERGERRLQVVVSEATAEGAAVSVYSQPSSSGPGEPWTEHAMGQLCPRPEGDRKPAIDFGALRARCHTQGSAAAFYGSWREFGFGWGPGFQAIVELWRGEGETLSRIELPAEAGGGAEVYGIHPVLLDAALQTLVAELTPEMGGELYLPFEVNDFLVERPGASAAWVLARRTGTSREIVSGDVTVMDERGEVLVQVTGVRLKRAQAAMMRQAEVKALPTWLYELTWPEVATAKSERVPQGTWLVLTEGSALGDTLTRQLVGVGARAIVLDLGDVIAQRSAEGVREALLSRCAADAPLEGILCVWGTAGAPEGEGTPADRAHTLTAAALHLVQALTSAGAPKAARLLWVTQGAQAVHAGETATVAEAPLWGLGRVLMDEHPELGCKLVDLEPGAAEGAEASWRELCAADDETQVAWRAGKRHGARLSRAATARGQEPAPDLVAQSTVLITGGLGGLGLQVARWLWEKHQIQHLLLVGRSAPVGERLAAVEALRAQGARVTVAQADVADAAAVRALLGTVPPELPLSGVIHAAGIVDRGMLTQQDAARFAQVLAPKVHGAWNLHVETRALPLRFFVMFSSVASVLGFGGLSSYAAGNAFLDALAHERKTLGLAGQSLNWGPWAEGGMGDALDGAQRTRLSRQGIGLLSPAEGLDLLERALGRSEAELCVLPLDLKAVRQSLGGEVPPLWRTLLVTSRARAAVGGGWAAQLAALSPEARRAEVETAVKAEVAKVLGLAASNVGAGRPLHEMGLDSMMAVELRNALSARSGKSLPATLVFDYPTVTALVRHLIAQLVPAENETPKRAAMPQLVQGMEAEPIAIVGIGCRYPGGASDLEGFWRLLEQGVDAMEVVPRDRWDVNAYYDPDPDAPGKMLTRLGGFLQGIDQFDAGFFGIAPREAVKMDPHQRILLEVSWEALERAGQTADRLLGSDTGVFVGLMYHDYEMLSSGTLEQLDGYTVTGFHGSVASGRISYLLGLQGPSMTLDTACSSSLVAVHLACQSLRRGECSMALAGGATVMLTPLMFVEFSRLRGLSPEGRCKTFSETADGVAWGEGCGMLVLKRLSDAQRDGDPILALIRGTAVNQDGRSNGLTAPNGPSQEAVIRRALAEAGVAPSFVDYVEAHGTGTPLGDPIEAQSLGAVLREGRAPERPVLVGSVKSNFGHTQAAAGVAGLIKVVACLQHELIPRSLHFTKPNPRVAWSDLLVKVASEPVPWPAQEKMRVAGASSFGASGTNAHVVMAEAPRVEKAEPLAAEASCHLLPLSAKTPEALSALATSYIDYLATSDARPHDIAYTASVRRTHHEHRLAAAFRSKEELAAALSAFARGEAKAGLSQGKVAANAPKVVFVFPGQGSQWVGMGRALLAEEPVFRAALEACDQAITREAGFSVLEELRAEESQSRFTQIDILQPTLFAISVALAALWRSYGVTPDAVVGHSMGEVAAAHVAGALRLEEAVQIVCRRSRLLRGMSNKGAMALVELSLAEAQAELRDYASRVFVAGSNSPRTTVLSGEPEALEELLDRLDERGVFCGWGMADVASHTPMMASLRGDILSALADLSPSASSIPMYSTVSTRPIEGSALRATYWADNLEQPVLFSQTVQRLLGEGYDLFVEVSPHPILVPAIEDGLKHSGHEGAALASLRREQDERHVLLSSLGALHARGYVVAWERLYPSRGRCVPLPAYPWQRQRFWVDAARTSGPAKAPPSSLYQPVWQVSERSRGAEPKGTWLVLTNGGALGRALTQRLASAGVRCFTVGLGKGATKEGADLWVEEPSAPGVFAPALAAAEAMGSPLQGVVCVWGAERASASEGTPADESLAVTAAALSLVHTLTGRDAAVAPSLWWVTEGAVSVRPGDSAAPAEASLWGLGRVLMAEHPELGCSLVDLEPGAPDGSEALWSELCAADDETQAAWRGGERYVARLIEAAPLRARQAAPRIVAESTVLITGGLGGLGLVTANWLWEEHHVQHLVLVGRSAPDGERLAAVEALRAQGARVTVAQADVTDRAAVRALLEAIPEEVPLRGVIHAACVLDDGVLAQQTPERFARVLSPKVRGAWNLHLETRALPLQFFVMFSSASSVLGVSGQSNYAAANAFLDALAHERRAEGLCAQSLNFGPWRDEGMAKYLTPVQRTRLERLGLEMLSTVEGVELLGQAISRPEAQLCVMPLNLKALEQASQGGVVLPLWRALVAPAPMLPTQAAQPVQAAKGSFAGRLLALAPETRLAAMQTMVRAEVAKVLGASDAAHVPNDRALQELGFGSLMVLELRNALAAQVDKALPATLVFNYPSVEALARYLLDQVELTPAAASKAVAVSTPVAATSDEPIAILGIGCRYPGGVRDPESYWRLLEQEIDAIREVPRDRWDIDAYYDPDPDAPGKMVTRWGGFIEGLDQFDPSFFEISPREAMGLDPQQRLLLEVTWEALERAGQTKERLWGSDTAVYMGMLTDEYRTLAETQTGTLDPYVFLGTMHSTSVARLSYWLGLQGPNMALDTACSASLVAVHLACQSLRSGESSLALAGGVNVLLDPEVTVCLSGMRAMSPTGRCHTFSADADGIVRSDGCGVVVLKRLSDAQRDGDPILAVIRGSAVNQDGRSNGLTAPNGRAQETVIRRALAQAGVAPSAVSYVEVHGTGTPLGDPIEVQALAAVLREGRAPDEPFTIGSVKTNFGHTEGAAGVGSLIKTVLMLQRGAIPKSLHFTAPNPHIPWAELPVKVATEAAPWNGNGRPRIAGVSSFGLSGTNAHVVLEEAPRPGREVAAVEASTVLLPLSAKSPEALMALAEEYRSWLTQNTSASLHDVAYTASERRTHHAHRLAVVGGSREELCTALEALGRGEPGLGMVRGDAPAGARPKVVFVFPGQGTQWVGMARQLLDEEPAFRDALVACDEAIRRETSFSVIDVLRADDAEARFGALEIVQPVLFAIEVALAALWRSWGVEPDAVVGHSMGEVAAAYVAGALSLPDAAAVICRRSRLFLQVRGQGAMAMVELPLAEARQEIQGYASRVFIAASNSPRMTVLSGELEALEELLDRLEERGVFCGWGMADVASHSPQMAGLLDELRATLAGLTPTSASLPMWSTVTGERVRGDELRADYWADNLSQPVLFSQVIGGLIEENPCLFVEISPHPVLLPAVEEHLHESKAQGAAVASLRRQVDERRSLLEAAGKLYVHGYPVAWARLYPSAGPCVSLPTYPFQRQRCWIDTAASLKGAIERPRLSRAGGVTHPLLGASFTVVSQPDAHFWEQAISVEALPYLAEHRVEGEVVVPGAAYTEMALAAAVELYGEGAHDIHDIVFERMLILPPEGARIIQVMLTEQGPGQASLQISSREPADNTWVQHATASVRVGESVPTPTAAGEALDTIRERCPASVSRDEHYQRIAARRIDFGSRFQGVEQLWVGTGEVLGRVRLPDEGAKEASAYQVHPAFLDACFQVLGGLLSGQEAAGAIVPVGLSRVRLERRPGR